MKKFLAAAAVATAFLASSAQANITVTHTDGSATYTGGTTWDFDSTTPANNCPSCIISTGTTSGSYAQPLGSTGNYFSTGPSTSDATKILFGVTGEYWMSMIWGSVDSYNSISFIDAAGNVLKTFTGTDVAAPADGNQTAENTNPVVTFHFSGTDAARVAGFTMTSNGQNAFEIDNIRVVGVPEPMTWAMMIMGFGMIGGVMRRRSATTVRYA